MLSKREILIRIWIFRIVWLVAFPILIWFSPIITLSIYCTLCWGFAIWARFIVDPPDFNFTPFNIAIAPLYIGIFITFAAMAGGVPHL